MRYLSMAALLVTAGMFICFIIFLKHFGYAGNIQGLVEWWAALTGVSDSLSIQVATGVVAGALLVSGIFYVWGILTRIAVDQMVEADSTPTFSPPPSKKWNELGILGKIARVIAWVFTAAFLCALVFGIGAVIWDKWYGH